MLKTRKFEVVDHLKTEKDIEEYLSVTLEEKDYKFLPIALADIARARKAIIGAARARPAFPEPRSTSLFPPILTTHDLSGNA